VLNYTYVHDAFLFSLLSLLIIYAIYDIIFVRLNVKHFISVMLFHRFE